MFHWHPYLDASVSYNSNLPKSSIAKDCLKNHSNNFEKVHLDLIRQTTKNPPLFYEIVSVDFEKKVSLYNFLTKETYKEVFTPLTLKQLKVGDLIFAVVIPIMEDMKIIWGHGKPLPEDSRLLIVQFNEFVNRCNVSILSEYNHFLSDIFGFYYDLQEKERL